MGDTLLFLTTTAAETPPDTATMVWVFQGVLGFAVVLIGGLANRAVSQLDKEIDSLRTQNALCAERVTALQVLAAGQVTRADLQAFRDEVKADIRDLKKDLLAGIAK